MKEVLTHTILPYYSRFYSGVFIYRRDYTLNKRMLEIVDMFPREEMTEMVTSIFSCILDDVLAQE